MTTTDKLPDLAEYFDPDIHLPINGKTYTVTSPGIDEAERLRAYIFTGPDGDLAEPEKYADEVAEGIKILGSVRDEMAADGVPDSMAQHAGRTALIHFGAGASAARAYWQFAHLLGATGEDVIASAIASAEG